MAETVVKAMFRRQGWHRMQKDAREPLWHRTDMDAMRGRDPKERALGTMIALCGYRRDQLLDGVQQRAEVKTKARRCARCDRKAGA